MSATATIEREASEDTAPTISAVRAKVERRSELAERLDELTRKERELSREAARLHTEGDSEAAEEVSAERSETRNLREDLEAALKELDRQIGEARERAARAAGLDRLQTIRKKCSGGAGEHPRRLERLRKAVESAEKEVEAINAAYSRQQTYRLEARALADRFGVEVPKMKTVLPPSRDAEASDLVARASSLTLARPSSNRHQKPPAERARDAAYRLEREHGEESPTPDLFEFAGEVGEDDWQEELRRRDEARKREMKRERQERREAVDTWLSGKIEDGPVSRDAILAAARDELADVVDGWGLGLTNILSRARRRLDVRGLVHANRPGAFWGPSDTDMGEGSPWAEPGTNRLGRLG